MITKHDLADFGMFSARVWITFEAKTGLNVKNMQRGSIGLVYETIGERYLATNSFTRVSDVFVDDFALEMARRYFPNRLPDYYTEKEK